MSNSDLKFRALEYVKNAYWAIVPAVEAIGDVYFWCNHAPVLNPHDTIVCLTEDGKFRVECIVLAVGATCAQVVFRPTDVWEMPAKIDLAAGQDYRKECEPATSLWSVIRCVDNHVMVPDLRSADAADTYIQNCAR